MTLREQNMPGHALCIWFSANLFTQEAELVSWLSHINMYLKSYYRLAWVTTFILPFFFEIKFILDAWYCISSDVVKK